MGFDSKGALGGAATGAGLGSSFGPWGTAIGGAGGFLLGGFGGGGAAAGKAPAGTPYAPNPSSFYAPSGSGYFGGGSGQPGAWWAGQAGAPSAKTGYVGDARTERGLSRGLQERGLSMLGQYARGDKSAARRAAAAQTERTQAAIASRLASTPGGYNPAVQRAALQAQSGAGQQIAGQTAVAAMREQLGAQKAYQQATGQMRQQDIASQMAEQQWYTQQMQAQIAYGNLKAKYLALGLQEKEADRRAKMQMEQMKFLGSEGQKGRNLTSQQLAYQQAMSDRDYWTKMFMGGMGAASGGLQQYGYGQGSGGGAAGSGGGASGSGGLGGSSPFKWY